MFGKQSTCWFWDTVAVVVEKDTLFSCVPPQSYGQTSDFIDSRIEALSVACPGLPPLVLPLQAVANHLYRSMTIQGMRVDPTLELGARLRLDHVRRIDSDIQADNKSHANLHTIGVEKPGTYIKVQTVLTVFILSLERQVWASPSALPTMASRCLPDW